MPDRELLEVRDLRVHFPTDDGLVKAVDGVSYSLDKGRTLGIVGESGSGKTVSSLTIMGLQGKNAQISGEIWLGGQQLVGMDPNVKRKLRGSEVAMIFQDPLSSLHPFYRVGAQLIEAVQTHQSVSKSAARARAAPQAAWSRRCCRRRPTSAWSRCG